MILAVVATVAVLGTLFVTGRARFNDLRDVEGAGTVTPGYSLEEIAQRREDERLAANLQVARPAVGPMKILFIGNALTQGFGATTEANSFRARMVTQLEKGGAVSPIVVADNEKTTAEVSRLLTRDLPPDLSLAVVDLSINDDRWYGRTAPDDLGRAYGDLLDRIRREAPSAALLCVGAWATTLQIDKGDAVISNACASRGGHFIALHDLFDRKSLHGPGGRRTEQGVADEFHPNDTGYEVIANRLLWNITVKPAG